MRKSLLSRWLIHVSAGVLTLAMGRGAVAQPTPEPPASAPTTTPATGPTSQSWELVQGHWEPLPAGPSATQPAIDPDLDRIRQQLESKQYTQAKHTAVYWIKTHKGSPLRDRGLYLLGEANFYYGDRIQAFYDFDELMDTYPESKFFYPALQHQYDIADAYLKGYKRRFLGLPAFGATDEAVEMLYRIQQRSPGSPLAEKSLLRTADYYYNTQQYDVAGDAYGYYVRAYPRSAEVPKARLRQAFANLAQFRGLRFDASPLIDAREQLVDLIERYPRLADEENIKEIIARVDDTFVRKIMVTADFYVRTHQPRAAAYNYKFLIHAYPKSPEAEQARRRLAALPPAAQHVAEPPPSNGYAPATQPSADAR